MSKKYEIGDIVLFLNMIMIKEKREKIIYL